MKCLPRVVAKNVAAKVIFIFSRKLL